jgi:hypothetical protein
MADGGIQPGAWCNAGVAEKPAVSLWDFRPLRNWRSSRSSPIRFGLAAESATGSDGSFIARTNHALSGKSSRRSAAARFTLEDDHIRR